MQIQKRYADQTAIKDRLISESRMIQNDGKGFKLYQTPDGPYWIPAGSELRFAVQSRRTGDEDLRHGGAGCATGRHRSRLRRKRGGLYVARLWTQGARLVVAIEPAPENIECLRRNFQAEIAEGQSGHLPEGRLGQGRLLELLVDPQNSAADSFIIRREGAKAVAKVPLTTIDKMVDELKLEKVDYIKMDIEGAEVKALEGGRKTLERFHPRMALSVYHQADHPVEVPRAARAAWPGYRTECGPCAEIDKFTLRPDVVFFY